jgi:ATP-dependent Lon protease
MDKKCMNPIIIFDEVDKISKTEHGKEVTGILTHLLDSTQNSAFQDKYFSGIDFDLSKVLFILSYNDPELIDKILLDRVTRIKFESLSIEDKIIISNNHLLPDLYKKIGLEGTIFFPDDTIKFIIEEYTLEPGVRKLKEKLFEIVGEINLNIFKDLNYEDDVELPIQITIDDIKNKYFKGKKEIIIRKVPENSMIGYANGMYATSLGNGGTLPIHAKMFPSSNFLELKLTGLQQDVMKESMHISLTIAWNLTSLERRKDLRKIYDGENNKYGINIHPGDGSVQKDGPSAGITITSVIYSLLNNIPIKPKIGMTGEIEISGNVSAIGGLNFKILGSIKAGIKEFIYPKENEKDFNEFYEKYKDNKILEGIIFHSVSHIDEVLELILEK